MNDLHRTGDAVPFEEMAAAGHACVEQLHDEALQLIADLAEHWADVPPEAGGDSLPAEETPVGEPAEDAVEPEPAEDVPAAEDLMAAEESEDVRVLLPSELPALPPLPPLRREQTHLATAVTDEFAVPTVEDAGFTAAA